MPPSATPDFLVIGHICRDIVPGGYALGGTATYSSLTARNLGRRVGVVTSFGLDLHLDGCLPDVQLAVAPSAATTTFENTYTPRGRRQRLHAVANALDVSDVPAEWRSTRVVLLGALINEVPRDMARWFPHSLVGAIPQGWMRHREPDGWVSRRAWDQAERTLEHLSVLVLSDEDVGWDEATVERLSAGVRLMVLTQGKGGASVYRDGAFLAHSPAFEVDEVDPTGAGDVFTAAYLVRLDETGDPIEAAHFANAVASFCVQAPGAAGIPTRAQVEARRAERPERLVLSAAEGDG